MQKDAEIVRLRTLAAAALLFAGVTLGFVLGRMSVWLIPSAPGHDSAVRAAGNHNAAAPAAQPVSPAPAPGPAAPATTTSPATAQPAPEVANPAGPALVSPGPAVAPSRGFPAAASTANSAAAGTGSQEPPKPVVAPNFRAAAGSPSGTAGRAGGTDEEEANRAPPIKLINPAQADAANAPAAPVGKAEVDPIESEADRQDIAACERRYSSFRRTDGTYQPFGGGPRQRCPLLR